MEIQSDNTKHFRSYGVSVHKKSYHKQRKSDKNLLITGEETKVETCKKTFTTVRENQLISEQHINSEKEQRNKKMKKFLSDKKVLRKILEKLENSMRHKETSGKENYKTK